ETVYKHILIPTDGSELSETAIERGVALARSVGARVTALTVSAPFHVLSLDPLAVTDTPEEYTVDCGRRAERYLRVARDAAEIAGVAFEGLHIVADHPYHAIIETARSRDCDLICMASHGRKGLSALVLGSETTKVLTHSQIAVLVCR